MTESFPGADGHVLPVRAQIIAVIGCVFLVLFVVDLVRRRRLKEEYSILWMAVSLGTAVLAAWGGLLLWVTHLMGAYSANSVIFFFAILFLMGLVLHLTVRVSGLTERNKDLVQEVALLGRRLEDLEGRGYPDAASGGRPRRGGKAVGPEVRRPPADG